MPLPLPLPIKKKEKPLNWTEYYQKQAAQKQPTPTKENEKGQELHRQDELLQVSNNFYNRIAGLELGNQYMRALVFLATAIFSGDVKFFHACMGFHFKGCDNVTFDRLTRILAEIINGDDLCILEPVHVNWVCDDGTAAQDFSIFPIQLRSASRVLLAATDWSYPVQVGCISGFNASGITLFHTVHEEPAMLFKRISCIARLNMQNVLPPPSSVDAPAPSLISY